MASRAANFLSMGLILDSTVPVTAERRGLNAHRALTHFQTRFGSEEIAISVVTLMELAHGAARAGTKAIAAVRTQFIEDLRASLPVYPVSEAIAISAGLLDGTLAARGIHVALSDLLIGVTALELGYKIATHNVRHFSLIPHLEVVAL